MGENDVSYDLFLSYNRLDQEYAKSIARRLHAKGLAVFLDLWYLVPGRPWPERLEELIGSCRAVAVLLGPNGMGGWQQRETGLAISRQVGDPQFPVIPVLLPGAESALSFLSLLTWVDFRHGIDDENALKILIRASRGQPAGPDALQLMQQIRSSICPFRGLRPFREEDKPFFFGREDFTERLIQAVEQHSLVAVVGASGSGKSSVVRAGLVPAIRLGLGRQIWEVAIVVPGKAPLRSLAAAAVRFLEPGMTEVDRLEEVNKLAKNFREEKIRLSEVANRILEKQPGTDRLLLVVDQWEEIYTLCKDDQARARFIDELLEATQAGSLCSVLTLRGDFFGRVLEHRQLADRLQNQIVNLGPMKREELARVIECPVTKVGLKMEVGLKERILSDLSDTPGSLPYLEFAMMQLWEKKDDSRLTHQAYETLGKASSGQQEFAGPPIQRIIASYAEKQVEKLPSGYAVEDLRRLVLQLVHQDEQHGATRSRIDLIGLGNNERRLVSHLTEARLLVSDRDEASGEETVELAHEALIRSWPRAKAWIDNSHEFLLWRKRLRSRLSEWKRQQGDENESFDRDGPRRVFRFPKILSKRQKRNDDELLRGALLTEAEKWRLERPGDLTDDETEFIKKSRALKRNAVAGHVLLVLSLLILLLPGSTLKWKGYDLMTYLLHGHRAAPSDIVIVKIDEESEQELGLPWKFPRSLHGELIGRLNRAGARAIVFDAAFTEPSEPAQDQALAEAIRASRVPVVLAGLVKVEGAASHYQERGLLPLQDLLDAGAKAGYVLNHTDPDAVLRRCRLSWGNEPSLVLRTLQILEQVEIAETAVVSRQGEDPEILINYVGPSGSISSVPFHEALGGPVEAFSAKVVFVGGAFAVSRSSLSDRYPTPVDASGSSADWMTGVEIQANALNTLLRRDFIHHPGSTITWGLTVAMGLFFLLFWRRSRVILAALPLVAYWGAAFLSFTFFNWFLDVFMVTLTVFVICFGWGLLVQFFKLARRPFRWLAQRISPTGRASAATLSE